MMKWCLCYVWGCLQLASVIADIERVDHSVHPPSNEEHFRDGRHNVEFDHESVLGSVDANREFEQLPPEEAKGRLRLILVKMDTNEDGRISKKEIADWVVHSFNSLNEEEAGHKIRDHDEDKNGQLTWKEYLHTTYTYTPEEIKDMEGDSSTEMKQFMEMVKDDEDKFMLADKDGDGSLTVPEFSVFLHPYNHPHMHQLEITRALKVHDQDKNGKINFKEYLGEAQPDKEQLLVDKEQFDYYDTNGDGFLESEEIKKWVLPDDRSLAEDEADHLFDSSDINRDGILSTEEIVDRYDLWVGSAATNYGQHLHDPAEL